MYYYLYKITNLLNNKIYIGVHKSKYENDMYYGSGRWIKHSLKKYGKENFKKEILEYFENETDMLSREMEIVNQEFIKRNDVYNVIVGGGHQNVDCFCVKDIETGEIFLANKYHDNIKNGKWISINKNFVLMKDENGNIYRIHKEDPRYNDNNLSAINKDCVIVKDENGNRSRVSKNNPDYISGKLIGITKGNKLSQKQIDIIKKSNTGKKRTEETKLKMSEAASKRKQETASTYDTKWIYNDSLKKCRMIKQDLLENFLNNGWSVGRKYYK